MQRFVLTVLVTTVVLFAQGQDLVVIAPESICVGEQAEITTTAGGIIRYEIDGVQVGEGESYSQVYDETTEVKVMALVEQNNIIVNSGFESGDQDFTSDYQGVTGGTGYGQYRITNNANNANPGYFQHLFDHTTGSGQLMVADGNTQAGVSVYRTTVDVVAGTEYIFSAWVANVHINLVNPPLLEFYINNDPLGEIDGSTEAGWVQFYTTWVSDVTGTITIELKNENTNPDGNDFAIDDIVFSPIELQEEIVEVVVNPTPVPNASADQLLICAGESVALSAVAGMDTYAWTPAGSLDDPAGASPIATPTATTDYQVTVTKDGCSAVGNVEITVDNVLAITVSPDTSICEGSSIALSASGGDSYTWSPAEGLDDPNSATPTVTPSTTTTYTVNASSTGGCEGSAQVTVTVETDQDLGLPTDISICEISEDSTIAVAPVAGVWSGNSISPAGVFSPAMAGANNVEVTFTPDLTCITPVIVPIDIRTATRSTITIADTVFCENEPVINMTADVTPGNWSGSGVTSGSPASFDPSSSGAGLIDVIYIPQAYCYARDTQIINVIALPDPSIVKRNFCLGQGDVQLEAATSGGVWSGSVGIHEDGTFNADDFGLGNYQAIYWVTNQECSAADTLDFAVSTMEIDMGPDSAICGMAHQSFTVSDAVGLATIYEWNINHDEGTYDVTTSGTYIVTGSDEYGCAATDTVFVADLCPCEIFVPNSFTPNDDGRNDRFIPKGRHELNYRIEIFNRWGQQVYKSDDLHEGWDGRMEGVYCAPDIYNVRITCPVGGDYSGVVQLLR